MLVNSDRHYQFDLDPDELWRLMIQVDEYRTWWPWLRRCDARTVEVGARWSCQVQPPLPYALRFVITIDELDHGAFASAKISGDITGTARIEMAPIDAGTEIRLVSSLAPAHPLLRAVAAVARPVAQRGHDWVLDNGLRQFQAKALPSGPEATELRGST